MKRIGIIGASGYTGHELVKILTKHPRVDLRVLNSRSFAGRKIKDVYPDFDGGHVYTGYSVDEINGMALDLLFLALPHGLSLEMVPKLGKRMKIVDLGADFRFKSMKRYEEVYGVKSPIGKNSAVYGLPELFKSRIRKARIVANPGCYVTASILATYPVQKLAKYVVLDCKSGWSGAGRESEYAKNPATIKDNMVPYKLTRHRHKYEIEEFIKTRLSFTPHVIDTFRGMMCTAHVLLKKGAKKDDIIRMYRDFYRGQPFVRIREEAPQIRATQGTNYCDIGGFEVDENNQLVIVSTIDNLLKGASGQAVQNMNLMLGFSEKEGLA